ncbi:procathepsin L-like [Cylas formicarius]|uniref:procathepsin L-like n=1 Tax=Cylas formicarius TaxID=197179 RepID=UPI00295831C9|nr:procathepsin L-like [Cylas formicarius]
MPNFANCRHSAPRRQRIEMKIVLVALLAVVASAVETDHQQWQSFKTQHTKVYRNVAEETLRFSIFQDNLRKIEEHNAKYENGEETYTLGVNQFADMTAEEFKSFLTLQKPNRTKTGDRQVYRKPLDAAVPASFDWRDEGAVSAVKDQGSCGGCWAFSVVASLEGFYYLKNKKLELFSEQNLIDCATTQYDMEGCNGGDLDPAFQYIIDHGIAKESDYPYEGRDARCRSSSNQVTKIKGFVDVREFDEDALLSAVALEGPVSVAIDANPIQLYKSGIFTGKGCSSSEWDLNHAVLAVGYGTENGQDYWILKNSWGTIFGEKGYFRMLRGKNVCGLADEPSYPVL